MEAFALILHVEVLLLVQTKHKSVGEVLTKIRESELKNMCRRRGSKLLLIQIWQTCCAALRSSK